MRAYQTIKSIYLLSLLLVLAASSAYPQDFNRATREVDRDVRKQVEEEAITPPKGKPVIEEEKAEEEEKPAIKFLAKKIVLEGCESFPPDEFSGVTKEYENRDVSLEELNGLAKKIEKEYLKRGIVAVCIVPPQKVEEGVVILKVIEAKMGETEVSQTNNFFGKKRLSYYWTIPPGEVLRYDKLSRSLQFMNKNPDREVKATMHAGRKVGTTDILLNSETYFPMHGTISIDNEGSVPTGRTTTGYGGKHNNLLGLDDTLMAGYLYSHLSNNLYAYHSVPITHFGTTVMYGFTRSESFPGKDFESYDLRSYAESESCFVYQDIFKKDSYVGEVYAGLEAKDKHTYANEAVLYRDRLRVLRLGGTGIIKTAQTTTQFKPEISQGLDILGARRASDVSSRKAGDTFTKLNLQVQHRRSIPPAFQLNLKGALQFATEKLTPQEEFSLGGMNSVRGYPVGDYYGDNAIQASVELLASPIFLPDEIKLPCAARPLKDDITALLFIDYGYGTKRGRIQGEREAFKLASAGMGIRIYLYDQALVRLEWGYPLAMGDDPISEGPCLRLHFSFNFEDRIHREVIRISKAPKEAKAKK